MTTRQERSQPPVGRFFWCGIHVALALVLCAATAPSDPVAATTSSRSVVAETAERRTRLGPGTVVGANEEVLKRSRARAGASIDATHPRPRRRLEDFFMDEPSGDDRGYDEPDDEFGDGLLDGDYTGGDGEDGEDGDVGDGDVVDSQGGDGDGDGGDQTDVGDEDPDGEDADGEDADGEDGDGEDADGEDADGEDADGGGNETDSNGDSSSGTEDGTGQDGDSATAEEQGTDGEEDGDTEGDSGGIPDGEGNDPPASSPADQPTQDASDGDGDGDSAPEEDEPSPASAPSPETPAPTRRPSHSAGSPQSPTSSDSVNPQDGPPSSNEASSYADMAKAEYDSMVHDRNVVIVATVFGAVGFILLLVTAQQMVENPDGCCAKMCRCSIAFWRVVCWPCRKVCGCARSKRRGHAVIAGGDNDYGAYSHDLELT